MPKGPTHNKPVLVRVMAWRRTGDKPLLAPMINWRIYAALTWRYVHLPIYKLLQMPWWRHQMEIFSVLLAICAGNSPITGEFPAQKPVTWSFDVFYDLRLNKRSSKQSRGCWFETPERSLWRHCNVVFWTNSMTFSNDTFSISCFESVKLKFRQRMVVGIWHSIKKYCPGSQFLIS